MQNESIPTKFESGSYVKQGIEADMSTVPFSAVPQIPMVVNVPGSSPKSTQPPTGVLTGVQTCALPISTTVTGIGTLPGLRGLERGKTLLESIPGKPVQAASERFVRQRFQGCVISNTTYFEGRSFEIRDSAERFTSSGRRSRLRWSDLPEPLPELLDRRQRRTQRAGSVDRWGEWVEFGER